VWELIFLMLVMKIPIAYLCAVVWWAVRAEPLPPEGAAVAVSVGPEPPPRPAWSRRPRGPRLGPHGSPTRSYPRTRRAVLAQARARR
jgi:hypothetical protein